MKTAVQFTTTDKAAPICPVAPAQTCPAVPFIECKPGPAILKCPPAVTVLRCPPAPKECHTAPVEACPAGPQQGWEDPRDWIDPVFKYRYVEGIGHTLVLVRKSQLPAGGPVDAAEAAEYGYGPEYWNQNATASKTAGETLSAKDESQPSGEFKPTARKRGK
jgi:hypothetical protein